MNYPVGTTVTQKVVFMNKAAVAADVDTLVLDVYLSSRHNKLGDTITLDPADLKIATGTYEVDYTIPKTIDTDTHKTMTFIFTGNLEGIDKVVTKTINIDWK